MKRRNFIRVAVGVANVPNYLPYHTAAQIAPAAKKVLLMCTPKWLNAHEMAFSRPFMISAKTITTMASGVTNFLHFDFTSVL